MFTLRQAKLHESGRKGRHAKLSSLQGYTARLRSTWLIAVVAVVGSGLAVLLPSGPAHATNACPPTYALIAGGGIQLRTNCNNTITQLTTNQFDNMPALSPDGSHVAFVRQDATNGNYDVWSVQTVAGGTPVQLTHLGGYIWRVAWSPNSQQLVLSSKSDSTTHLYEVNADGTGQVSVAQDFFATDPAWCGSKLVVAHPDPNIANKINLYTMNPDGSGITQVTFGNEYDSQPACTPDNKWVVFPESISAGLFTLSITGGTEVLLRPWDTDNLGEPSVSNDWTLAYVSTNFNHVFFQWLGDVQAVSYSTDAEGWPSFSPGNGSVPAPAGFPIAWSGSPAPVSSPYAALGDSYSSGEGNPPYDTGTNTSTDKCHRSSGAWPRLLATQDSRVGPLSQFACSGATTSDITSTSRSGEPPQITALKGLQYAPSLVTITIGGNDIGFAQILKDCFASFAVGGCAGDGTLQTATDKISKLVPTLVKMIQAVESAAPGAKVVLVGYPSLFPAKFNNTTSLHCPWLGPREDKGLVALAAQLNSAEQNAANQAGVGYVPTLTVLSGHELCTGIPGWQR